MSKKILDTELISDNAMNCLKKYGYCALLYKEINPDIEKGCVISFVGENDASVHGQIKVRMVAKQRFGEDSHLIFRAVRKKNKSRGA